MFKNFFGGPKSTATGIMGLLIAGLLAVNFDDAGNLHMNAKSWVVVIIGIGRAYVDFSKQDAGVTSVTTPDNQTPHLEPSSEVPSNPDAVISGG